MAGGGIVGVLVACACAASFAPLAGCGGEERGDPRAAAAPAPVEHASRGTANVLVVVDTSEGMDEERLERARAALDSLVRAIPPRDRVGLARFSEQLEPLVPVLAMRQNRAALRKAIGRLRPGGGSGVYDATLQAYGIQRELSGGRRLNAVLVLAHGEDSESRTTNTRVARLLRSRKGGPRLRVFTIAYDTEPTSGLPDALADFARASGGEALTATPQNVGRQLRRAWEGL